MKSVRAYREQLTRLDEHFSERYLYHERLLYTERPGETEGQLARYCHPLGDGLHAVELTEGDTNEEETDH